MSAAKQQDVVINHHIHAQTCAPKYVVTVDLPNKVEIPFRRIGLTTPRRDDPFYQEFTDGLVKKIGEALPRETDIQVIKMEELASDILSGATKMMHQNILRKAFIVSTCSEIANLDPGQGRTLSINRLIDFDGNIIGVGPRPGAQGLRPQIASLVELVKDRPIILVEDGSFTGNTLVHVTELLKEKHINVAAIVLGFTFFAGIKLIREHFDGEVVTVLDLGENIVDWMPDHDFIPGIHNNGRVVGIMRKTGPYPYYDHDGTSFSVPYLKPFTPFMKEWTSLSGRDVTDSISFYCLQQTRELFRRIAKLNNNQPVTVGMLKQCNPRVCVPFCIEGSDPFARDDQTIDDILREAENKVFH